LHKTYTPSRFLTKQSKIVATRDVSGTNLTSHNSFALLDDDAIHERALEMGVNPETFTMENINYLKDLEQARHAIDVAQTVTEPETESDTEKIMLLGDREQGCEDEDDFTHVLSRKKRRKRRSLINSGRRRESPITSGDSLEGAQSKSSAALGKVNNFHPSSGIVTGTRCRKRNPRYL
jgi:hypothetical protein